MLLTSTATVWHQGIAQGSDNTIISLTMRCDFPTGESRVQLSCKLDVFNYNCDLTDVTPFRYTKTSDTRPKGKIPKV